MVSNCAMLQKSCAQPEIALSTWAGTLAPIEKNSKVLSQRVGKSEQQNWADCFAYSLRRNQDTAPQLQYCFLTVQPCFCIPPFYIKQLFEYALWNGGMIKEAEWSLCPITKMGTQKGCVPLRVPHGLGSVSSLWNMEDSIRLTFILSSSKLSCSL